MRRWSIGVRLGKPKPVDDGAVVPAESKAWLHKCERSVRVDRVLERYLAQNKPRLAVADDDPRRQELQRCEAGAAHEPLQQHLVVVEGQHELERVVGSEFLVRRRVQRDLCAD